MATPRRYRASEREPSIALVYGSCTPLRATPLPICSAGRFQQRSGLSPPVVSQGGGAALSSSTDGLVPSEGPSG